MAILDIYERGAIVWGYKIRENNQDTKTLLAKQEIQLI
jgi:hypothetical protein